MVSTVKSRPNYYEMLGLTPSAAGDAIAQAFARATSAFRPHAFGGITELCVAYDTLRDPARRRAYDASLGLAPRPLIQPVRRSASAHFMQLPAVTGPSPEPQVEQQVASKPPEPITQRTVHIDAPIAPQPVFGEGKVGFGSTEWKRTGIIFGGLAASAVLVGAMAGLWSGSSAAEPDPPQRALSPDQQPEKPSPTFSELWSEPTAKAAKAAKAQGNQPRRVASRPRNERTTQGPLLAASEAEAQLIQPPQDLATSASADPLAPEATPAPAAMASMPLPHKTVARTIDRIGYSCGSVAAVAEVDGAAGVYKVSCTSGQSFQAKPVKGRYRFRRLGRN